MENKEKIKKGKKPETRWEKTLRRWKHKGRRTIARWVMLTDYVMGREERW